MFCSSIDFFHLVVSWGIGLLERWEIIVFLLVIFEDAETQLDHSVDSISEGVRFVEGESGGEERSLEE